MKRTIRGLALTLTVTALSCLSALAMGSDPVSVAANDLVGTKWNWVGTQMRDTSTKVEEPLKYTLDFTTDTSVSMQADCNKGSGSYKVEGNNLRFGPFAMTRMACPPGSNDSLFVQSVSNARKYKRVGDNSLVIEIASGATLTFARALSPSSGLMGTKWNWLGSQTGTERLFVPMPIRYTLEFRTADTVYVKADCNTGSGTYKVEGDKVTIGPMAMTMMACPPGSLDMQFKQGLGVTNTYKVVLDHMIFVGPDGSSMLFARATSTRASQ